MTIILLQIYCWVCFERNFKSLNIWQSYGKAGCLKRPVRRGTVLLKDEELAWGLMYGGQQVL